MPSLEVGLVSNVGKLKFVFDYVFAGAMALLARFSTITFSLVDRGSLEALGP
jgi:hypothetical protein